MHSLFLCSSFTKLHLHNCENYYFLQHTHTYITIHGSLYNSAKWNIIHAHTIYSFISLVFNNELNVTVAYYWTWHTYLTQLIYIQIIHYNGTLKVLKDFLVKERQYLVNVFHDTDILLWNLLFKVKAHFKEIFIWHVCFF